MRSYFVLLLTSALVCLATLGFGRYANAVSPRTQHNDLPDLWVLQPLITGSLVILLLMGLLDVPGRRLPCWMIHGPVCWVLVLYLVLLNAVLCAAVAGQGNRSASEALTTVTVGVAFPTVLVVFVSAYSCLRRTTSQWLRLVVALGVVTASALVQWRSGASVVGPDGFGFLLLNSCLMGLSVLTGLFLWGRSAANPPGTA